jgi:5-methylcytosine-specific restriction endonuclease McrA
MPKKAQLEPTDGLGPRELKRISSVIRAVWYQCRARNLVKARCKGKDGFFYCEKCKERTPVLQVDHLVPAGSINDEGFILRLFCPSSQLQGLCKKCHAPKTRKEAKARRKKKQLEKDFY